MTAALACDTAVRRLASARMPTAFGDFEMQVLRSADGQDHAVLIRGDLSGAGDVHVRVHSECLTGDIFGSCRCDCGGQLCDALRHVAASRLGAVIYLRGQKGRRVGLVNKLRADALQQCGRDTVEANLELGLPVDTRSFESAARHPTCTQRAIHGFDYQQSRQGDRSSRSWRAGRAAYCITRHGKSAQPQLLTDETRQAWTRANAELNFVERSTSRRRTFAVSPTSDKGDPDDCFQ